MTVYETGFERFMVFLDYDDNNSQGLTTLRISTNFMCLTKLSTNVYRSTEGVSARDKGSD